MMIRYVVITTVATVALAMLAAVPFETSMVMAQEQPQGQSPSLLSPQESKELRLVVKLINTVVKLQSGDFLNLIFKVRIVTGHCPLFSKFFDGKKQFPYLEIGSS